MANIEDKLKSLPRSNVPESLDQRVHASIDSRPRYTAKRSIFAFAACCIVFIATWALLKPAPSVDIPASNIVKVDAAPLLTPYLVAKVEPEEFFLRRKIVHKITPRSSL